MTSKTKAKRFKDFGKGSDVETEPLSFKLHDEEFSCVTQIQGSVLLGLAETSQSGDNASSAAVILDFFEKVLLDESYVRFEALINSKDRIVTVETLGEITGWLLEEYTNRPE